MSKNVSGICYKSVRLIAINSSLSYGRVRFTFAHELYHLYYDGQSSHIVEDQAQD